MLDGFVADIIYRKLSQYFVTIQSHAHINAYARIKAFICKAYNHMSKRCARQCDFANGVLNSYNTLNKLSDKYSKKRVKYKSYIKIHAMRKC